MSSTAYNVSNTTVYYTSTTAAGSGSYFYVGHVGSIPLSINPEPVLLKSYKCEVCENIILSESEHNEASLSSYGCDVCEGCLSKRAIWLLKGDKCTGLIIGNKIFTKPENIRLFSGIQVIKKMSIPLIEYDKDEVGLARWEEYQKVLY